jgi:hypothetical protein
MPGVAELPAWIWRRIGRPGRIGVLASLVAAIALGAALTPGILESKEERAESERRARAERRAQLVRRLEAEQRPRFRRSPSVAPPGADAERRLDRPIRRVRCRPFPRTVEGVGADEDLSRRRGRYACVAVTAEFDREDVGVGGVIGHPYRVLVDFEAGRYAFCKISGQAGPAREQLVTTPRACGGR